MDVWSSPSEADCRLVVEAIAHLELAHLADKPCTYLSGGECQQVLIARAVVQQAETIILNGPANHLDCGSQLKILRQMKRLAGEGCGLIWTAHMPDHALLMGGRAAILGRAGVLTVGDASLLAEERLTALCGAEVCLSYVQRAGGEACVPCRLQRRKRRGRWKFCAADY